MEILIAFFGFFALMSAVALVRFEGNPLFLFSLLLSAASLIWLIVLKREERTPSRRVAKRRAARKRSRR